MRLTERKTIYPKCDNHGNLTKIDCIEIKNKGLAEEKLCQLEDIEEELGIDLITLFKALKNGFWYKKENDIFYISKNDYLLTSGAIHYVGKGLIFAGLFLSNIDYGKTWALTREELLWLQKNCLNT